MVNVFLRFSIRRVLKVGSSINRECFTNWFGYWIRIYLPWLIFVLWLKVNRSVSIHSLIAMFSFWFRINFLSYSSGFFYRSKCKIDAFGAWSSTTIRSWPTQPSGYSFDSSAFCWFNLTFFLTCRLFMYNSWFFDPCIAFITIFSQDHWAFLYKVVLIHDQCSFSILMT